MDAYDEGYLLSAQEHIDSIRSKALAKARLTVPDAAFVIDRRTDDLYYDKVWEYPGQWYVSFRLPDGFSSEEKLIDTIAAETVRYYLSEQKKPKHRRRK